jgi:hypothetical protein
LALLELAGPEIVPDVGSLVSHQRLNRQFITLLVEKGWEPADEKQRVYCWIAFDYTAMMLRHWDQTKHVLLADMSQPPASLGYAPHEMFLRLRKDDPQVISALVAYLRDADRRLAAERDASRDDPFSGISNSHVRSLAERYRASGHPTLWRVGLEWLSDHGTSILVMGPGESDWRKVPFDKVSGNTRQWR